MATIERSDEERRVPERGRPGWSVLNPMPVNGFCSRSPPKAGTAKAVAATDFDVGHALYLGFFSSTRTTTPTWWR